MFSRSNTVLKFKERPFQTYTLIEEAIDRSTVDFDMCIDLSISDPDLQNNYSEFYYAFYEGNSLNNVYFASVNTLGEDTMSADEIIADMSHKSYGELLDAMMLYNDRDFIIYKINNQKPSFIIYSGESPAYDFKYFIRDLLERAAGLFGNAAVLDSIDGSFTLLDTESMF